MANAANEISMELLCVATPECIDGVAIAPE